MSRPLDIEEVAAFLRQFAEDRDWQQFHTPKNLAMALSGEAGELVSAFQWLTPEESWSVMNDEGVGANVKEEMADVLQYLIRLADVLGIDLTDALWEKLYGNRDRFPVD